MDSPNTSGAPVKVYCEHGAFTPGLKRLHRDGRIDIIHFPYEQWARRANRADPSEAAWEDLDRITWDELDASWDDFKGSSDARTIRTLSTLIPPTRTAVRASSLLTSETSSRRNRSWRNCSESDSSTPRKIGSRFWRFLKNMNGHGGASDCSTRRLEGQRGRAGLCAIGAREHFVRCAEHDRSFAPASLRVFPGVQQLGEMRLASLRASAPASGSRAVSPPRARVSRPADRRWP